MKGQTIFRNLIIGWYLSEKYGLTIRAIRCAVCKQPIELTAIKVGRDIFLACPDGHLVGSNVDPGVAKEWLVRSSATISPNNDLMREYKNLENDVKEKSKTLSDLQKWEFKHLFSDRRHFAEKHEYNNKVFELIKEFRHQF